MTSVKKYIESNKDRFIEELFSLIRIPSISAKHEHKPDMEACAKRWTELLLAAGAESVFAVALATVELDAPRSPTEATPIHEDDEEDVYRDF